MVLVLKEFYMEQYLPTVCVSLSQTWILVNGRSMCLYVVFTSIDIMCTDNNEYWKAQECRIQYSRLDLITSPYLTCS